MSDIKIFKVPRSDSMRAWEPIIKELKARGYQVYHDVEPADVSIVLSGKLENPLCFSGKRVLAFTPGEWQPEYYGWRFYARILENYYDDFINLGQTTVKGAADKIEEYIKNGTR